MVSDDFYAEDLAYIHHVGFPDLIEGAAPFLLRELKALQRSRGTDGPRGLADPGGPGDLVVDLGCGGGGWSHHLLQAGFRAWGCDLSPSMVAIARRTAPEATFEVASLFETGIPACLAVTALGEGFNYGMRGTDPASDLAAPFARIAQALVPGGLFAFDLVVQPSAEVQGEAGEALHYRSWKAADDWAVLISVEEDLAARRLTRDAVIFREVEGRYRRSEEQHVIGVPSVNEVLQQLAAAGFEAEAGCHYGDFQVMPRRAAFLATRMEA